MLSLSKHEGRTCNCPRRPAQIVPSGAVTSPEGLHLGIGDEVAAVRLIEAQLNGGALVVGQYMAFGAGLLRDFHVDSVRRLQPETITAPFRGPHPSSWPRR